MEVSGSLISKVHSSFSSNGLHFATPLSSLRASEIELVRFLVFLPPLVPKLNLYDKPIILCLIFLYLAYLV